MLTHLSLTTNKINEPGTGCSKGLEIYPTTPTLLSNLKVDPNIIVRLKEKQKEVYPFDMLDTGLREYQKKDVFFLAARQAAACFNEQRTGKTPTILTVLKKLDLGKTLIVCPATMVLVWQQEYKRWRKKDCVALTGNVARKQQQLKQWTSGAVISYESLRTNKNGDGGMIDDILKIKNIECVILDEGHRIANRTSQQMGAVFKLRKIPYRYVLTGTPVSNKTEQIYTILHFLYPNIFTGYWRFVDYYYETKKQIINRHTKDAIQVITGFKPGKDVELQEFLNAISTQRKRKDIMKWLPDIENQIIYLDKTKEQTAYLLQLHKEFEIDNKVFVAGILDKILRERQLCLHPKLLDLKGTSPKLDWLKQYTKDYKEQSILIFSKFTKWLELLSKELKADMIVGTTKLKDRQQLIEDFQSKKINILLLNIDAAKEGITLDTADVAIFTDQFPPVGSLRQAQDRLVATQTDKANTGHLVIKLLMKDSYEEVIERGIQTKLNETALINEYVKHLKGGETIGNSN